MELCNCNDEWSADNSVVKFQHFFDSLTAIAHFAIPLELIYFIRLYGIFPYKVAIIYFGTYSILCGAKYVTNTWRYSQCSETTTSVIMIVQISAAVTSWLTVVVMYFVTLRLLQTRENEHLLNNRIEDLSRQTSLVLCEVTTRRSIVSLIDVIRSTLDGHYIIKSTVAGLGQIFDLEECSFWFPSHTNKTLRLSHSLNHIVSVGSVVPMSLPLIAEIFSTIGAVRIPHTCPLVRTNKFKKAMKFEAVAIRLPLSSTESDYSLKACAMSYAAMVLALPPDNIRIFREYELELLGAVAEEVSVALGHASAIEESILACDHLKKQISSKEVALREMEIALRNSIDSKTKIFHPMDIPVRSLIILSSFLLETTLTPQQRAMAEMILKKSSTVETLSQNERELSELQDDLLVLNLRIFHLLDVIKQAVNMIKPAAALKKLSVSLALAPDFPVKAVGDLERLMQVFLIVMGNAVKFTKEGYISVTASMVEDTGCGIDPQDLPNLFNPTGTSNRHSNATVGLAMCKWLVGVMDGRIWVESDGVGKGCTATIIVKLGVFNSNG